MKQPSLISDTNFDVPKGFTASKEPKITTDNLGVAQFLHPTLHNNKLRRVIDTITSKVVLILGRAVLDALRDELRKPERNYVPVVFDFEQPASRTTDETTTLLGRMAQASNNGLRFNSGPGLPSVGAAPQKENCCAEPIFTTGHAARWGHWIKLRAHTPDKNCIES